MIAANESVNDDLWYIGKGAKDNLYLKYKISDNQTEPYLLTIYFEKKTGDNWTALFLVKHDNGSRTNQTYILSDFDMSIVGGDVRNITSDANVGLGGYLSAVQYVRLFSLKPGHSLTKVGEVWHEAAFPTCDNCTGPETTEVGTVTVAAGTFNATKVAYKDLVYFWINKDLPFPIKGLARNGPTSETMATPHEFELVQIGSGSPPAIPEFPFSLIVLTGSASFVVILTYFKVRSP